MALKSMFSSGNGATVPVPSTVAATPNSGGMFGGLGNVMGMVGKLDAMMAEGTRSAREATELQRTMLAELQGIRTLLETALPYLTEIASHVRDQSVARENLLDTSRSCHADTYARARAAVDTDTGAG